MSPSPIQLKPAPYAARPRLVVQRNDVAPVLFVGGTGGATYRYRVLHHREQLRLSGIATRSIMQWHPDLLDAGLGCGHVILHRVAWDPGVQALIDQTRDSGGIVLYDIDDLVFEPESTHLHHGLSLLPPADQALYHDGVRRYRKCLLTCDGAVTPTEFLAERVRALGLPTWVSRNCIDLEILALSDTARVARATATNQDGDEAAATAASSTPFIVGYASGSRTHDRDFAQAAGPALRRLMDEREDIVLRLVGPLQLGPEWEGVADRVQRVPAVDWRELPAVIAGFDLSLAPLEVDNPFCQAKSELKWLEAAAVAVPSVAADTGAFRHAIEAASAAAGAEAGLLARDEAQWVAAIASLLDDPERAHGMGEAARLAVEKTRTTAGQAKGYEALLGSAHRTVLPDDFPPAPPERAADGLRINVLMPEPPRGSGGHTSIMRLVAALDAAGHNVTVHIDAGANMRYASEAEAAAFMRAHFPRSGCAFRLGRDLAPADVAIATGWTTARAVAYASNVRTKLYLVQDFEPFFQALGADWLAAEATYRLNLGHVTLGPWLAETLRDRYGAMADHMDFGVNHAIYHPREAVASGADHSAGPPRVVFYGRASTPRRGTALGLEALARVKAERPEVEIVLYGGDKPGLADFTYVNAGVLTQEELAELYRGATCGLALSYTNLSFVPLEMAACGLPVVAVDTEPCAWYQKDGLTCALAEPTADGIAEAVLRVLDDPDLRTRLSAGGREAVAELSWERNVARFVEIVERYVDVDLAFSSPPRSSLTGPLPAQAVLSRWDPASSAGLALVDEHVATDAGPRTMRPGEHVGWTVQPSLHALHRIGVRVSAGDVIPARGTLVLRVREHASAPEILASASLDARSLPDAEDGDTWTDFQFGPLHHAAHRALHLELAYVFTDEADAAETGGDDGHGTEPTEALAASDTVSLRPGWRAHGTELTDRAEVLEPTIEQAMHQRRRTAAAARVSRVRLERRPVLSRAIRMWQAATRPLPPVPLRPWSAEASTGVKLLRGLRTYGPLRVARELGIWRRWHRRTS